MRVAQAYVREEHSAAAFARAQRRLPAFPAAGPALHRHVLPVRHPAVRLRDGRRARRRRGRAGRGRSVPGRAHGVPAVPGHVLHPDAAAVPGVRRLPAGEHRPRAHRRSAAHTHLGGAAARGRAGARTGPAAWARWSSWTSSFAYTGAAEPALEGVSLHVAPGETVALVGATGAGKSTIVKLLARFYDVDAGAVLVDGIDVRRFRLAEFRHRLGVVPQEPHLFTGDVAANIAYAPPGRGARRDRGGGARGRCAGDGARAARRVPAPGRRARAGPVRGAAPAHRAGPRRAGRSRPAAASTRPPRRSTPPPRPRCSPRATGSRPGAPRSSWPTGSTTAARADRVVVLAAGRIVELGTHAELLATGGVYAGLWAAGELEPAA